MPDNTPLGPGTSYPWDPQNQQPAAADPAAAAADAKKQAAADKAAANAKALQPRILSQYEQQAIVRAIGGHDGWTVVAGAAVPKTQLSTNTITGDPQMVPTGSYTVTLADPQGRTHDDIVVTPGATDENGVTAWVPSSVAANAAAPAHPDIASQNGQPAMTWDPAQNKYVPLAGAPTQGNAPPKPGDKRQAIESGKNVEQTYDGGQWVTTTIQPGSAIPGAAVEGNTQDIVENGRYVHQEFHDGKWNTVKVGDSAIPGAPKPGDKRPSVENGRNVEQTYDGTTWRTTGVGDSAMPGAPKANQTRQVVENGRNVTQTYDGTQWNTTALGDLATPGAAKAGDTRPGVENGQNVTQTFDGTTWRTTGIGTSAMPGAAKEGDTRKNVQGGFTITEKYQNGTWIPDTSVPPVRFTPQDPSVVSAPNTQQSIVTMQNGQIGTQANPNFMPTTTAEVAARVAQLQGQAQAQRDAIQAKQLAGQITAEQATQQFNQWYTQNIEPQKAVLDAAQRAAQQAEDAKAQEQQRANLATAQTGAGAILTATENNRPNSPAYAAALGGSLNAMRGKPPGVDYVAALSGPGLNAQDIYEQATAKILQHISPTAAQIATGQPVPTALGRAQGTDINQALNRTNYGFGGAPPPPPPPPTAGGVAAPVAVAPTPVQPAVDFNALQQRQAADVAAQRTQAQVSPFAPPPPTGPMTPDAYAALQARILADQQEQARQAQVNMGGYQPANYQPAF